jgi:RNA polymerase sigma-70 factor (ECF subfamily)
VSGEADGLLQTAPLQNEDGRVTAIHVMRNPDKLARLEGCVH